MNPNDYKKKIKEENLKTFYSKELKKKDPLFGTPMALSQEEVDGVEAKYDAMCQKVDACGSEEAIMDIIGKMKH